MGLKQTYRFTDSISIYWRPTLRRSVVFEEKNIETLQNFTNLLCFSSWEILIWWLNKGKLFRLKSKRMFALLYCFFHWKCSNHYCNLICLETFLEQMHFCLGVHSSLLFYANVLGPKLLMLSYIKLHHNQSMLPRVIQKCHSITLSDPPNKNFRARHLRMSQVQWNIQRKFWKIQRKN